MKRQEVEIGGRTVIDVVMEPDILGLDEVVVTALGICREKKALGYSVQDVTGDEIAKAKETNVINSLQGRVSGAQITAIFRCCWCIFQNCNQGSFLLKRKQPAFVCC